MLLADEDEGVVISRLLTAGGLRAGGEIPLSPIIV